MSYPIYTECPKCHNTNWVTFGAHAGHTKDEDVFENTSAFYCCTVCNWESEQFNVPPDFWQKQKDDLLKAVKGVCPDEPKQDFSNGDESKQTYSFFKTSPRDRRFELEKSGENSRFTGNCVADLSCTTLLNVKMPGSSLVASTDADDDELFAIILAFRESGCKEVRLRFPLSKGGVKVYDTENPQAETGQA